MNTFFKSSIARLALLSGVLLIGLVSCQKGDPSPFATPSGGTGSKASGPDSTFVGSVNGSPTITFSPNKTVAGGYTSLIGTTANYTVTVTFPSTTGPGHFFLGSGGFTASLKTATDTYNVNATYGTGSIYINSIGSGRYNGTCDFIGEDVSYNSLSFNGGTFNNL